MSTMQAYRIERFGGPEVLQCQDIAIPEPHDDEVLIAVRAASLNPVDYKTRSGTYPLIRQDQLPYTLGRDFAGSVISTARHHADGPQVGDAVYAFIGQIQGAFAQYVVIPHDWLAPKPATLDFCQAAAVPLAALTAWQGLFEHGRLQTGERVLIHAAAGGVGHFAVQFAKAHGAEVYASASGDNMEWVRSLGADHVIDYHNTDFTEAAREIDVVFDLVGGATQQRSWSVLKDGGALISTVAEPDQARAAARGIRASRYTAHPDAGQLTQIGQLIDAGRVEVRVTQVFPFAEAVAAQRKLEAGHNRGKIVLDFGSPQAAGRP